MRRYFFKHQFFEGSILKIEGDQFLHIVKVCRQEVGAKFEALTPDGRARTVELYQVDWSRKVALGKVLSERVLPDLPFPKIHLCLSYPKRETFSRVLVKAVELGVASFHGFPSDFSHRGGWVQSVEKKEGRWAKMVEGALQQTGRGAPFHLTHHSSLDALLSLFSHSSTEDCMETFSSGRLGLVAYEKEGVLPLGALIPSLSPLKSYKELWVFVGSEGGFSPQDLEKFNNSNILSFGLGDQVLRVETACVTVVSVLKYLLEHYS